MLLFACAIWTLLFFSFISLITSISTIIGSLICWYTLKKRNYSAMIILNLLIIIPAHLFYGGQITYTFKPTYKTYEYGITFYLGFILYFLLFFSYHIHNFIISKMEKKNVKKLYKKELN